jgi:hypothetical protein
MIKQSPGILPTCKEVHALVSEGMDRDLSLSERLRLRVHLLMCVACRRFGRQMVLLRGAMRSFPAFDTDASADMAKGGEGGGRHGERP